MRFVHIADVHLGMSFKAASFAKAFGKEKREAIKKNFKNVINYISSNNIELLLIAGDFLESDYIELKDLYDINYLFQSISSTKIVIMTGNHDPQSLNDNIYSLIEWSNNVIIMPTNYSSVEIKEIETSIISVSWKSKGPMKLNKEKLEKTINNCSSKNKILMLHGDCYVKNDYMFLDSKYLKGLKVDYAALGHIHKHDILHETIVYPGSLEPLDFSESYNHGFIAGDINASRELAFELITSMIYPMETLSIDTTKVMSYLGIIDIIKERISHKIKTNSNLMLRILLIGELHPYIGDIRNDLSKELKEIYNEQLAYVELVDKTIPGYDIEVLYEEHKEDLIGYYIRAIRAKGLDKEVNKQALSTGITLLLEAMR